MSKAHEPTGGEQHLDPKQQAEHHDEVIVAPRGTKKARFIMTFLLVVMLLTTFVVSDQILSVFGTGSRSSSYVSWTDPDGTQRKISGQEFYIEKRKLQPILGFAFPQLQSERDLTDEQVASFLVLENAADRAGVRATDKDISRFVQAMGFQNKDQYMQFLRMYALTGKEFESIVRRVIRYRRYVALITAPAGVPDPEAVEQRWKTQHQEYSADYVELPVSTLEAEARTLAPDAAALRAWYEGLPENEKAAYRTKEKAAAELAAFTLEGDLDASRLFAKYPRPADEDAEAKAREFHAGFSYVLYRKEKPEPGVDFRKTFDEAKEQALIHAPIYNSMLDWQKDVQARSDKGEAVDLSAESTALGLTYRNQIEPIAVDAWQALSVPWIGSYVLNRVFAPDQQAGTYFPSVVVDAKGFVFGKLSTKIAPTLPDYDQVADAVLSGWARQKAKELALAKLEKVRDAFGTRPDPNDTTAPPFKPEVDRDAFLKAVADAGLTAQRRDWAEQNTPPSPDGDSAAVTYLRQNPVIFTNKVGTVPKPEIDRQGNTAILVRLDGVRDPSLDRMTPADVQMIGMQLGNQERAAFLSTGILSRDALVQQYGLDMASWHEKDGAAP
jgi:hypothetical protein